MATEPTPTTEVTTPVDQTPTAPAAETQQPPAATTPVDPEEAEYLAAKKELETTIEAFNAGQTAPTADGQQPTDATPARATPADGNQPAAEPTPQPAAKGKRMPMVPISRLSEVSKEKTALAEENAYLKGQLEVLKAAPPTQQHPAPGTAPAQAQQTPEQQITALRQKQEAVAADFDSGKLSLAEFKKQDAKLDDQIFELRSAALKAAPKPDQQQPMPQGDLYLEQKTAELEDAHPYVNVIPPDHPRWEFLKAEAIDLLAANGIQIPAGALNAQEKFVLRQKIAEISDHYGQVWYPNLQVTKPQPGTGNGAKQPQTPTPGQPSQTAQQRFDKLSLAASTAPNAHAMGAATETGGLTPAAFANLSEDEAAALPRSVRDQFRA